MGEEKHKINCWIPESLWKQIEALGYESPTEATKKAFEALILKEAKGSNEEAIGCSQEVIRNLQETIRNLQEELGNKPDPIVFIRLQAEHEGLKTLLEGKDRHISSLEADLRTAERDKEDLKAVYNNYFLQVQTLINQKALEAPGSKKPRWKFW